jgi:hypothetical protein
MAGTLTLATDPDELAVLRMPLTPQESQRLVQLGLDATTALEASLLVWEPGERECSVALPMRSIASRRYEASPSLVAGHGRGPASDLVRDVKRGSL